MASNISICSQIKLEKDREEKERRKKEKTEAHLYTIIKVFKSTSWAENISYCMATGVFFHSIVILHIFLLRRLQGTMILLLR
jgi:hypothetical protein